ncbi:MAG: hypothetical protein J6T10_11520 [Methanobrevibacter sp.]|nr:hypothetical protein [Methanobrevibacter sp.]
MWIFPTMRNLNNDPPTIYALLNSYVNYDVEEKTKIKNLASEGRGAIFDFDYPLSDKIDKEDFETLILNHYMMRRIGFDTPTAFKIGLNAKLNEIMPNYNKLFDALDGWDIFTDGEVESREVERSESTNTSTQSTEYSASDLRNSNMPQNKLDDIRDGKYVSDYNYNQNNSNANANIDGASSGSESETITRTPSDKIRIYKEFIENRDNIMTLIFKDLDILFYGLA